MIAEIDKCTLSGSVQSPTSKSMAHRLLICAALSKGESLIQNVTFSDDIYATMDCLEKFGAKFQVMGSSVKVSGMESTFLNEEKYFHCKESGSTMRFIIPLILLSDIKQHLSGEGRLMQRPQSVYEEICKNQNLTFKYENDQLTVCGKIKSGDYIIKGDVSSQFITGMIFALSLLNEDSRIYIIPPFESAAYVDMTIDALSMFGVEIKWEKNLVLYIKGAQKYTCRNVFVEGDYSGAAFLDVFNYFGGNVDAMGLNKNSLQGDMIYLQYYKLIENGFTTLDVTNCPDLAPVLMTLAACKNGVKLIGTKRLKIKESDRGVVMAEELSKFGAKIDVYENEIIVHKSVLHKPTEILNGHNDHRIVMSLVAVSTLYGAIIDDAEAVKKSFPDFFDKFASIGGKVKLYDNK